MPLHSYSCLERDFQTESSSTWNADFPNIHSVPVAYSRCCQRSPE